MTRIYKSISTQEIKTVREILIKNPSLTVSNITDITSFNAGRVNNILKYIPDRYKEGMKRKTTLNHKNIREVKELLKNNPSINNWQIEETLGITKGRLCYILNKHLPDRKSRNSGYIHRKKIIK